MAKWQGYGIGLEKQYYMLRNAEDAALCVNITKYAEMRSNENLNSTCTLKNDLYDDFEE